MCCSIAHIALLCQYHIVCACSFAPSCLTLCKLMGYSYQAPLSLGFFFFFLRQEYWNGFLFAPPGHLPNPGIEPASHASTAFQADSLPLSHLGSLPYYSFLIYFGMRECDASRYIFLLKSALTIQSLLCCIRIWGSFFFSFSCKKMPLAFFYWFHFIYRSLWVVWICWQC